MISYNPSKIPTIPPEMLHTARELGQKVVSVICDSADDQGKFDPQNPGLQFMAITDFIPRIGDDVSSPDGRVWTVQGVSFKSVEVRADEEVAAYSLVANVYATPHKPRGAVSRSRAQ